MESRIGLILATHFSFVEGSVIVYCVLLCFTNDNLHRLDTLSFTLVIFVAVFPSLYPIYIGRYSKVEGGGKLKIVTAVGLIGAQVGSVLYLKYLIKYVPDYPSCHINKVYFIPRYFYVGTYPEL